MMTIPLTQLSPTKSVNISTYHSLLNCQNDPRKSMVFMGPTDIMRRQSLGVRYTINTTQREYNAIEYLAFYQWSNVVNKSLDDQRLILRTKELCSQFLLDSRPGSR